MGTIDEISEMIRQETTKVEYTDSTTGSWKISAPVERDSEKNTSYRAGRRGMTIMEAVSEEHVYPGYPPAVYAIGKQTGGNPRYRDGYRIRSAKDGKVITIMTHPDQPVSKGEQ